MRALGLPNTKHFHEITRIEDALSRSSILPIVIEYVDMFLLFSCREA